MEAPQSEYYILVAELEAIMLDGQNINPGDAGVLSRLSESQLKRLSGLLPEAAAAVTAEIIERAEATEKMLGEREETLVAAAQFALSVLKHNGLFDLSERIAYNKLAEAIELTTGETIERVEQ